MTIEELIALVPLLILASISVILMLVVTLGRHHRLINLITQLGFIAGAVAAAQQIGDAPIQITPLVVMDDYSRLFIIVAGLASVPAALLAYDYLERSEDIKEEYYMLLSLAVLGAGVLAAANHFVSFFIGLELLSVSLFAMVGYMVRGEHRRLDTLEASVKYMILSGVSSSFLLFGVALMYMNFGALVFDEVYQAMQNEGVSGYGLMGAAMIVVGLAFKLSWAPFHMWTPDVYQGAPAPVTAFLATVSKVMVFALALRFFVESGAYLFDSVNNTLAVIALFSIFVGNILGLMQSNLKRLLAYSSVAHLGYLMIALIAASAVAAEDRQFALEAVVFYLIAYALMTWLAFGVVTVLSRPEQGLEAEELTHYTGMFWRRPLLAGLLSLTLLSLAGIPLTAGFVGKFYIFTAGVVDELWWLLLALVAGSAIGLYYYLKIILEMCKPPERESSTPFDGVIPMENRLMLSGLGALILIAGIYPQPLIESLALAVRELL